MQSFGTAKAVLKFTVFIGWVVIILAVVAAFALFSMQLFSPIQIALGVVIIVMNGLITVTIGQMGLAQIATAENTREMAKALLQQATSKGDPQGVDTNGRPVVRADPPISRASAVASDE